MAIYGLNENFVRNLMNHLVRRVFSYFRGNIWFCHLWQAKYYENLWILIYWGSSKYLSQNLKNDLIWRKYLYGIQKTFNVLILWTKLNIRLSKSFLSSIFYYSCFEFIFVESQFLKLLKIATAPAWFIKCSRSPPLHQTRD